MQPFKKVIKKCSLREKRESARKSRQFKKARQKSGGYRSGSSVEHGTKRLPAPFRHAGPLRQSSTVAPPQKETQLALFL